LLAQGKYYVVLLMTYLVNEFPDTLPIGELGMKSDLPRRKLNLLVQRTGQHFFEP